MAGALLGALSFVGPAAAGEAADFTGPYVGFNLGYGFGQARERSVTTPGRDSEPVADPALPPSAAAAARALRPSRGETGASRTAQPAN